MESNPEMGDQGKGLVSKTVGRGAPGGGSVSWRVGYRSAGRETPCFQNDGQWGGKARDADFSGDLRSCGAKAGFERTEESYYEERPCA